jgi:cytochrome o ubiquinol oxidase operon protein cyoD
MGHDHNEKADFGTGQKKLSVYIFGLVLCSILTIIAFWAVMSERFSQMTTFVIIYGAACIQFFVQLICFLRLNTQSEQGKTNVMSLVFTGVILLTIIVGSLWIMWNLNYYMMH